MPRQKLLLGSLAFALSSILAMQLYGQNQPVRWKTGPALETQLELPAGITWSEMPLAQGLENLSRSAGVAIWLDRRVDPDQKVVFAVADTPFEQMLERLATHLKLSVCRVGPVMYMGPPETSNLGTLAAVKRQESETLPAATQRAVASLSPTEWDELAEPRELVEQAISRCGLRAFYLERVPHDLWPARQLPSLHAAELLTLLLAGFELSFEYAPDGSAIRPVDMPSNIVLVREYPHRGNLATAMAKIREFFPEAELTVDEGKLRVAGSEEEHRQIARFLSGRPMRRTITSPPMRVYTLEVQEQPIGAVIAALAKQLGKQAEFDPALTPEQLNQKVSFSVKEKTLAELLQTALEPAGLRYELLSEAIKIGPAS